MAAYSTYTDQELMALLKQSDRLAYSEIFIRYNSLLYLHAFKKFKERENARDIVQEVFTLIWARREQLDVKANVAGFLYTTMHHKILDWFGHQKIKAKYVAQLQQVMDEGQCSADGLIRTRQLSAIINLEIESLPPKMKQIFKMSRYEQLSHKEIAERLCISEETVKSQVKNALKILRAKLGLFVYLMFLIRF